MNISVVIPTYNRIDYLLESIESVIQQRLDQCEVIVCDDGSTEDVVGVCKCQYDPELVKVSRTEHQLGAQVARNRGLEMALGEFVLFLDSDDVLAPRGLNALSQELHNNSALDYVYGKVARTNDKLVRKTDDEPVGATFSDAPIDIAGYHWHTMGALYRKSYLSKVGHWNVDLTGSQDWEYQARVKLEGGKCKFVDSIVGYWRQHDGDRVGTTKFRPDYVNSVMTACDVIIRSAKAKGRCDEKLEMRLAKRLFVHALEWGSNGYRQDRKKCFLQAKNYLSSGLIFKGVLTVMACTPLVLDRFMSRIITGR